MTRIQEKFLFHNKRKNVLNMLIVSILI